jgi:hypothetical protein
VFHPNTESAELSTRPRKRCHLEIQICVENLNKKLLGPIIDKYYLGSFIHYAATGSNLLLHTHLGIKISWLNIRSGMAGMWSFFSLAKFMIWNNTSWITNFNAERLELVSSGAFTKSMLHHKLLLQCSMGLGQLHENHKSPVIKITFYTREPFWATWFAIFFWVADMQIDEPLFPINALCFVAKPTWVFVFLIKKGETYLRFQVKQ